VLFGAPGAAALPSGAAFGFGSAHQPAAAAAFGPAAGSSFLEAPPFQASVGEALPQPRAAAATAAGPGPSGLLSGGPLLSFLNLQRTTEGFWRAGPELASALGLPLEVLQPKTQPQEQEQPAQLLSSLRPTGLCDDGWATLLVLAVLRRRLASQPEVWADMQAKALTWLEARWPTAQGAAAGQQPAPGSSVGSAVLAVAKALDV
jgi:hypothetical protein